MTVFLILLAVAALAAAVVMGVRVRRQGVALGAAADRIAALQADLDDVRTERAQQTLRADTAEAAREESTTRAGQLERELQVAASTLADAIRTRDAAQQHAANLEEALAVAADAGLLWSLELARVERRWHMSVAPGIGLTSPLAECSPADQPRVALEIIASALREETGTRFAIDWHLTSPLPQPAALAVVRAGEEMLSAAALQSDQVHLRVAVDDEQAVLTIEAVDDDHQPITLPPVAPAGAAGAPRAVAVDGSTVRVPIPAGGRHAA